MKIFATAILLATTALAAAPARASDKTDFADCDGLRYPGKGGDGMTWAASTDRFQIVDPSPGSVIAACDRALASPRLLPTHGFRRAHLLRARAAAKLKAGNGGAALEDIALAEEAVGARASDRFHQRSMGLSLKLLRALALADAGKIDEALPIAREALALRPYALQVQNVAARLLHSARKPGATDPSPWLQGARLDPDVSRNAFLKEIELGSFAAALKLAPAVTWPEGSWSELALAPRGEKAQSFVGALLVTLGTGYARAATGDPAGARRDVEAVRSRVAALRPATGTTNDLLVRVGGFNYEDVERFAEMYLRQVEARIAVAEGKPGEGLAKLVAAPVPHNAALVELLRALKAALPEKDAALIADTAPIEADIAKSAKQDIRELVPQAMLAAETPRAVVDYERARPNVLGALVGAAFSFGATLLAGIDRTDGFRSTPNPDGTITVEFIGDTTSAALVQEMTLLRAAEVAREAAKPAFVITARKDFTRRISTTQYGVEISSVPAGFKTELTIRPVDSGVDPAHALDAVSVIDALGPFYYEAKPAKR